jgi:GNAT superfamily N-acetyltransferase
MPTIRAALVDDARRVAEIHVAAWRAAYRGHMPDEVLDNLSVDQRAQHWTQIVAAPTSPERRLWLADVDGRVDAFAATGPSRDTDAAATPAEVYAIYADPTRWGRGAGRALMSHVVEDLAARRLAAVTLWVLDANERARRFYEIAGFVLDGAEKAGVFGGRTLNEVRYRRALGA